MPVTTYWLEIADSIKTALTDQVIKNSFRQMPDTIYSLTAEPFIKKLKARRDNVGEIAQDYYHILAKDALIVGSTKHEHFVVKVLNNKEVQVQVYKTQKDEQVKDLLYDRTFNAKQTKNINLYGLDGKDHFVPEGDANPEINISIWGGEGEDTYSAESKKQSSRIFITDSTYGNNYKSGDRAKVKHNDNLRAKDFNGAGFLLHFYLD